MTVSTQGCALNLPGSKLLNWVGPCIHANTQYARVPRTAIVRLVSMFVFVALGSASLIVDIIWYSFSRSNAPNSFSQLFDLALLSHTQFPCQLQVPRNPLIIRTMSRSNSVSRSLDEENVSELDIHQFQAEVYKEITRIEGSENRRVSSEKHLLHLQQSMLRVFDRLTALFSIHLLTGEKNRNIVTEVGVSIYDPRLQELALMPNIKSYHFIIQEHREHQYGLIKPNHSSNFCGDTSHLISLAQARQIIDSLICHYFGPEFPLSCLFVGHGLRAIIRSLKVMDVFIHPKVPKLDTQVLYSRTHGLGNMSLKNALLMMNQPYSFLYNAGNIAHCTTLLALKLCDPMVRRLTGIDYFKKNERRDKPTKYRKREANKSGIKTVCNKELLDEIVKVWPRGLIENGEPRP